MHLTKRVMTIVAAAFGWVAAAQQSTPYVITDFPIAAVKADTGVTVRWAGLSRGPGFDAPDSGDVYYSRTPGGSKIANYPHKVTAYLDANINHTYYNDVVNGNPPQRQIIFRPVQQLDMQAGVFYCMVAWPVVTLMGRDTLYSNELPLIVETSKATELLSPTDTITDLTPTFTWKVNPGVPYYHVILSDEKITIDSTQDSKDSSSKFSIKGLSIIWQAITPNTQIVYGAPDPSGTITASPPPLSPGKTYSVVVLNNYGNNPAYTSTRFGLPKTFTLKGDTLKAPRNVFPAGDSLNGAPPVRPVRFVWRNLDTARANTYKVYIYVASDIKNVGAQLVVWENEVTAATFKTGSRWSDSGWVDVDAGSVLTQHHYTWKVIAVDDKGAGRSGDTTSFDYYNSPTGTLRLQTKENIVSGEDTLTASVAAVEIKVEVLQGSMEKPLLFYTDNNGLLSRSMAAGTYRITAQKKGFESTVKTLSVLDTTETDDTIYMKRPDATIFGTVVDEAGTGVDLATVVGVSDRGDTVRAQTDKFGSFVLSCYEADWEVWAQSLGYIASLSKHVTVSFGQSVNFGTSALKKVPYTVSGVVKNTNGDALIGVDVRFTRSGQLIGEVPSTSQNGSFSFSAEAGTYTIEAVKTGFVSFTKTLDVFSSAQVNVSMAPGAAMVTGYMVGHSWIGGREVLAPITKARIAFVKVNPGPGDTVVTVSNATYGDFGVSLAGNQRYVVRPDVPGFVADVNHPDTVSTDPGKTISYSDTLTGMAMVHGRVVSVGAANQILGNLGDVSVVVVDTTGAVTATVVSQADGSFELRNIPDGRRIVRAGGDGVVVKTVSPGDTFRVTAGRPSIDSFFVEMIAGKKTIKWRINNGADLTSAIRLQSPLQKTLTPRDSLTKAGAGDYLVVIDPVADSVLPLAYHKFTVDTEAVHTDSVELPVRHQAPPTLRTVADFCSLSIRTGVALDSARIYYRDITMTAFESAPGIASGTSVSFGFKPQRDGSNLVYYFKAYAGLDIYGSSRKTFRTFVTPSPLLTKLDIWPGGGDTLTLPADYRATFSFQAYYSSALLRDSALDSSAVTWRMNNEPGGCVLEGRGLSVAVRTSLTPTDSRRGPVELVAAVDQQLMRPGVSNAVSTFFWVSKNKAIGVVVERVDARNPNPISTSAGDNAQFTATATDSAGGSLLITPTWTIEPAGAGLIDRGGAFVPRVSFAGHVRVKATCVECGTNGDIVGEFNVDEKNSLQSGLEVRHAIQAKARPDTVDNMIGCRMILPDSIVGAGVTGLLAIAAPLLNNVVERGLGSLRAVGNAYDISEVNGVALRPLGGGDSIRLTLDIPPAYQDRATRAKTAFHIGRWDEDTLRWLPRANSVLSADGKQISAAVTHLSRYAVLAAPQSFSAVLRVSPNPFSPYAVRPRQNGEPAPPPNAAGGTWISFVSSSQGDNIKSRIRIFNLLGDQVFSATLLNTVAEVGYYVWWNGKTTGKEISLDDNKIFDGEPSPQVFSIAGDRMCRNGRYFVVLTIADASQKEKQYVQQVMLIK